MKKAPPITLTTANSITVTNVRNGRPTKANPESSYTFKQSRQIFPRQHTPLVQRTLITIMLLILLLQQSTNTYISVQAATYSVTLNAKDTDCYVFRVPKKPVTIRYDNVDLDFFLSFRVIPWTQYTK
jgi:hypothetical protein